MTFIVIIVLAFLIIIVFKKNKTVLSVAVTITCLAGATTAVLAWGLIVLSGQPAMHFFYANIGSSEFYPLIALWYAMDLLCSVIIIRRYFEYRKINRGMK